MKRLLFLLIVLAATPCIATTWTIRDDGGDRFQCDGRADLPFTGVKKKLSSSQRKRFKAADAASCALNNPMFLMEPGNTPAWRVDYHGGDTVQYKHNAQGGRGAYEIGLRNPKTGKGQEMWTYYGYYWCNNNPSGCHFPPFLSGTKEQPTRWLGPCYPDCSNANGTDVKDAAKLVGINGVWLMLDFSNAQWFDVEGFELTQYTQCSKAQGPGLCVDGQDDYANHAIQLEYLVNQGPSNGILRHIAIHGIAGQALLGSHLNKAEADTMVFDHMYARGDGLAGLDSDGGGCKTDCPNTGRVELTNSYFDFIGCVTPYDVTFNLTTGLPNSVNFCKASQTGGYGDAVVFIAMASAHIYMRNVHMRYATQDGGDLLHMGDNTQYHPILEVYDSESVGNMGQTFKIGGGGADTYFINNFANANCKAMTQGASPVFAGFPAGWNQYLQNRGDYCRAYDAIAIFYTDDRKTVLIHNVITGYASPFFDMQCVAPCTGKEIAISHDNIMYGFPSPEPEDGRQPAGYYLNGMEDPYKNPGSSISHNVAYKMRDDICQQVPEETDYLCTDPKLKSETNVDTFDPSLISNTAPVYKTGVTAGLPTDYFGQPWGTPPSRGLSELVGTTPPPSGYRLAGNYQQQVKVVFHDAAGAVATVQSIAWSTSDTAKLTATPDSNNPALCMVTPVSGALGHVQAIAKGYTDATNFVTASFDVEIIAATTGPAVNGTITPTGDPVRIPGR